MKLLLIMPRFFNYPEMIIEELTLMGYEVDFYDDRPSTNAWVKAAIRVNKNLISNYIKKYFNTIMNEISGKKYDVVFLISGQSLSFSEEMIEKLKKAQPNARYILYQWDSEKNFPYIKKIQKYFDKCYSFDKNDVSESKRISFLPLFYGKQYERIGKNKRKEYKYDFCFIGTAHPKKYKYIKMISEQLKNVYPKQFIYFFFPSPIVFFYRKIANKELRRAKYSEFHYKPLSKKEVDHVYMNSRCILDSAQAGQIGLTIRIIESLGAKKKIITTNEDVQNYDFYKPENIYIYDGKIDFKDVFFESDYVEIEDDIYRKYSLRSWLKTMIEE